MPRLSISMTTLPIYWPLFILLFILLLLTTHTASSSSHHKRVPKPRHTDKLLSMTSAPTNGTQRGIVFCSSNKHHMIAGIARMIYLVRRVWNSTLPFAVCHCGEINEGNRQLLVNLDESVRVINLCESDPVFQNMTRATAQYKLRGFFCKVAALLKSPFEDSMIVDIDVVWLNSPDKLFDSPQYKSTGSLFFRDRTLTKKNDTIPEMKRLFEERGIVVTNDTAKRMLKANGFSFFWRHYVEELKHHPFPAVTEYQDSSVVLVSKKGQAKMLKVLESLLCNNFDLGYGDKEIFWCAATIAQEPFSFEPFLAGQYGDCFGHILHFDPSDALLDPSSVTPFYINAEYMVEEELHVIGQFLQRVVTTPISLVEINYSHLPENVTEFNNIWSKGGKDQPDSGCVCARNPCQPLNTSVNIQLAISQWLTLTMRLKGDRSPADCLPVLSKFSSLVKDLFDLPVLREDCTFFGCPSLPYELNTSLPAWNSSWPQYCEPVAFSDPLEQSLRAAALEARSPFSLWNKRFYTNDALIQCGMQPTIYVVRNFSVLQAIPDKAAFLTLGRDFSEVKRIPVYDCERLYSFRTEWP